MYTEIYNHEEWVLWNTLHDEYFQRRAICKPAVEANGRLDGETVPEPSTRRDLADWLNLIAEKIGIERTVTNPQGYLATEENIG